MHAYMYKYPLYILGKHKLVWTTQHHYNEQPKHESLNPQLVANYNNYDKLPIVLYRLRYHPNKA